MKSYFLLFPLLLLGLSACTGQAEFTSAVADKAEYEGNKPKFTEKDLKRMEAGWYLTDELVRAEKDLVAVHFPYLVSTREVMKYIKSDDIHGYRYHYEGWNSSGSFFEGAYRNMYEQLSESFTSDIESYKESNLEFLKQNREAIEHGEWEKISYADKHSFYHRLQDIQKKEKFNIDSPLFHSLILKSNNEDLLKLKAAHPEMKFSGTVFYAIRMEKVEKIAQDNYALYLKDIPEEELQATILKEFEKSGLKK